MNPILKKRCLIIILIISFFAICSSAQNSEKTITLSKISNHKKVKQIDPNSYFKVKTINGKKLKGKFASVSDNYFISTENDTILLNEIYWIKAKSQISGLVKALAITGVFAGIFFSFGTVPAALSFIAMESNFCVILAPAATISASVIGIRTLGGRRYKLKRWKLETIN